MNKKKLIDELSELAQICLDYKNHVEFEKKQHKEWLSDELKCLWKLWRDKYGCFYSYLCNAEEKDLIWWKLANEHFKEFEKKLKEIVDDYTKNKNE